MAMFKCSGALFNGTIVINTTANATVTATTSGTTRTFTAVANASGVASIRVKKRGTYSIASTGTTRVGHATVSDATPVTAYYVWNRYNSAYAYSQATKDYNASPRQTILSNYAYAGSQHRWTWYSSISLNTGTGKYNGTVSSYEDRNMSGITDSTDMSSGKKLYWGQYGVSGTSVPWYVEVVSSLGGYIGSDGSNIYVDRNQSGTATWRYYYSTGYYYKGSYKDQITATSLSAYPTNARSSSDGYWYVAA